MKKRSLVVGVLAAGLLAVAGQASASANVVWCLSDPPILVATPGGHNLMVNNMVFLPPQAVHLKSRITDSAAAVPDGHGGTLVVVWVRVPEGVGHAVVVSADNRYRITTSASTEGGQLTVLLLDVPLS